VTDLDGVVLPLCSPGRYNVGACPSAFEVDSLETVREPRAAKHNQWELKTVKGEEAADASRETVGQGPEIAWTRAVTSESSSRSGASPSAGTPARRIRHRIKPKRWASNVLKSKRRISFRLSRTALAQAPAALPDVRCPGSADAANAEAWERFLRRTINFFYECSAVGAVEIAERGHGYYNWAVRLRSENSPTWLEPHLPHLLERTQQVREAGRKPRLRSLRILASGQRDIVVNDS
jgi:hypothetical protein